MSPARPVFRRGRAWPGAARRGAARRGAVAVTLVVACIAGMLAGLAPPASAAGTLTSLGWAATSTASGAALVGYTYTFTPATSSAVKTVTMTVPAGTVGTPAVGTVTPSSLASGDSVALAGGTLTFTSTAAPTLSSSTPVSIQITGLTNTSTPGSYTSLVSTNNASGTLVDSGTTPAVIITGPRLPPPAGSWPFSEGSGTTTADTSGNGNTGTLGSGVTWAAPEVGKYSIALNGTAAGAVTIPGPVVNTAASYTVSAWVYMTAFPTTNATFVSITGLATPVGGTTVSGFFLQYQNGTGNKNFSFTVKPSDAEGSLSAQTRAQGPSNVTVLNTWYHIVGVYNSVAQTIALYINGTLQQTTSYTTAWQATGNTMIGQGYYGAPSDFVTGRIDDVALYSSALTAAQVAALNQPTISSGFAHTCEITNGNAYCWGLNANGELGNNSTVSSTVPVPVYTGGVLAGVTLTQISAGDNFTCALSSAGFAYCWGVNTAGQLGTSAGASSDVPVAVTVGTPGVPTGTTPTQLTAGNGTVCALASTGAAYCWGQGTSGQLGDGTSSSSLTAMPVSGGLAFAQIDAGGTTGPDGGFVCGVTTAGAAYCWGGDFNAAGAIDDQLGSTAAANPQTTPIAVTVGAPSAILSTTILTQVTTGSNFACALSNAGAAYCWGAGSNDQLGDNTSPAAQATAVAVTTSGVLSGVTLTQVNAGNLFVCALGSTGAAYCWGHGTDGDLGDNVTTSSIVPAAVTTSGVLTVAGVVTTLTQVSPGGAPFTCALDTFGTAYCWGTNSSGQAGNPDTTTAGFPVPATVQLTQPVTIAAGTIHSCEINSGKAYCWGDNSNGELGNNSTMTSSVPVAAWTGGALSGLTLTQIATGTNFSCALSSAGAAYCWGLGTSGQLGNGASATSNVPVAVSLGAMPAGTTLTQITAGGASACALASTGAAFCWGAGGSGQLGNGTATAAQPTPVAVTTSGTPLAGLILTGISSGGTSTCALASTGAAYCWGAGGSGQLGNGTATAAQTTAVAVTATPGVLGGVTLTGISDGGSTVCALAGTGVAFCWGLGTNGQLGNSASATSSVPVAVTTTGVLSGVTVTQLDVGSNSSCALSSAGLGYCWGGGAAGQLGNGTTTAIQNTAVAVTATGVLTGQTLTQITVGTTYACTLSNTGADFCWGENSNGQDGNPATALNFSVPAAVMAQPTMIASGYSHACLLRNGKAYCWGDDTYGELGNNTTTTTPVSTPVAVYTGGVLSGLTLIQISAGQDWTCALASTGNVYCWGNNSTAVSGDQVALGNNTSTASDVPVLVSGGYTFTQISVGADFACGLTSAGVAYCWGNNKNDQMGNGGASVADVPGAVTATSGSQLYQLTLTQIAAGGSYACALASTGAAYCWGLGTSGQLGNSASVTATTAVAVTVGGSSLIPTGTALTNITAGATTTCALSSAGAAYCWGAGGSGQLGNGSTTAIQNTAVAVTATATGLPLAQITAGTSFACAVDATGVAYCWGLGTGSQLGNDQNSANSSTPVAVTVGAPSAILSGTFLTQISSGQLATCTEDTTGAFYCWGGNTTGQLGNASTTSSDVAVSVAAIVPGVPAGVNAFPTASGAASVYWAAPVSFGTGTPTGYTATASPGGATCTTTLLTCTITGLTNGTTYTITVVTDTTDGNSASSAAATVIPWSPDIGIASGWTHACVLSAGLAYCWGDNTYGQLGNNSTTSSETPVAVYTGGVLSGVTLTQIASGEYYTCALSSVGNVYCWGADANGQLGDNIVGTNSDVPVAVYTTGTPMAGVTISQIAVGQVSVCALSTAGLAYCWGASPSGQLGNGTAGGNIPYPVAVTTTELPAGVVFVQLSSAGSNTCAIASNGTAWCWGINTHGQVGNGNTGTNALIPAAVVTTGVLSGVTLAEVTNGYDFACGLSNAGAAYCWGLDSNGELGNSPSTTASNVPVAVITSGALSGVTLTQLSGGEDHVCALSTAGAGYCWGDDGNGELGNNSTSGSDDLPVAVYTSGLLSGVTLSQVSSGAYFTCTLSTSNYAYCWGANTNTGTSFGPMTGSLLGNDSTIQSPVAVYVGPQAPTTVTATPGNTTATVSWTAPVYLNNAALTGYAVTASSTSPPGTGTCTSAAGTLTCGLTGLTDGATYSVTVTDTTSATSSNTSAPSSPPATVTPAGLSLTGPTSLSWTLTGTGVNQSTVDSNAADEQFTVGVTLTAGWNVSVSATTFTNGTHTLPSTGTFNFNGSLSSPLATTAPTATCVATCAQPTAETTSYPVNIITAASPALYEVYSTPANTGEGVFTVNPIGWWVQVPANTYAGSYTSTVTLEVVSGP